MIDLRCGDYRETLADVTCDALIADPPYSTRTHAGHDAGASLVNRKQKAWPRSGGGSDPLRPRRAIAYAGWSAADVDAFVDFWAPRNRGWFACMSDSVLCEVYRAAFERNGLVGFQPLPCVIPGMTVRMSGDGPSSWAVYLNVARPKSLHKWGTLRGAYVLPNQGERVHIGGKPMDLMREVVRDYSRAGDVVCDPCAGGATTLIAAAIEGRKAIGSELDPATHALAMKRIETSGEIEKFAPSDVLKRAKQSRLPL